MIVVRDFATTYNTDQDSRPDLEPSSWLGCSTSPGSLPMLLMVYAHSLASPAHSLTQLLTHPLTHSLSHHSLVAPHTAHLALTC